MKDEEKRCVDCVHNEEHLKAIQEGKQGSAICMLECNASHTCFELKESGNRTTQQQSLFV